MLQGSDIKILLFDFARFLAYHVKGRLNWISPKKKSHLKKHPVIRDFQ